MERGAGHQTEYMYSDRYEQIMNKLFIGRVCIVSVLSIFFFLLFYDFPLKTQGVVYLEFVKYPLGLQRNTQVFAKCNVCMSSIRFPVNSYSSQLVLKSIHSHFGQFVLIDLVKSYSFGQIVFIVWSLFGQFVLILVNSSSLWSTRSHIFGQFVLILVPLFWEEIKCLLGLIQQAINKTKVL